MQTHNIFIVLLSTVYLVIIGMKTNSILKMSYYNIVYNNFLNS